MRKNSLYAAILYSGFVSEKRHIYRLKWNIAYKRTLRAELKLWSDIVDRMKVTQLQEDDFKSFHEFLTLCNKNKRIMRNHIAGYDLVNEMSCDNFRNLNQGTSNPKEKIILDLLEDLISDSINTLNTSGLLIPGKELSEYIRALHNLPRYFFYFPLERKYAPRTSFELTLEYTYSNLGEINRIKYSKYF